MKQLKDLKPEKILRDIAKEYYNYRFELEESNRDMTVFSAEIPLKIKSKRVNTSFACIIHVANGIDLIFEFGKIEPTFEVLKLINDFNAAYLYFTAYINKDGIFVIEHAADVINEESAEVVFGMVFDSITYPGKPYDRLCEYLYPIINYLE